MALEILSVTTLRLFYMKSLLSWRIYDEHGKYVVNTKTDYNFSSVL